MAMVPPPLHVAVSPHTPCHPTGTAAKPGSCRRSGSTGLGCLWNHGMGWVGGILKIILLHPSPGEGTIPSSRGLQVPSKLAWGTPRDPGTASMDNLCQGLAVKKIPSSPPEIMNQFLGEGVFHLTGTERSGPSSTSIPPQQTGNGNWDLSQPSRGFGGLICFFLLGFPPSQAGICSFPAVP